LSINNEIVGGAVWEIQDILERNKIILQLDALFVRKGHRRKGYGTKIFEESLKQAIEWYKGFKIVGLVIQTTSLEGTKEFYEKTLKRLRLSNSVAKQKVGDIEIIVFLISL